MKRCSTCKEIKEFTEFNKDKSTNDGLRYDCKICFRKVNKKYREKNREKALEYSKKYRVENREKVLEYSKKYREKNRGKLLEYWEKYRGENKEKVLEYNKKYYEENREKSLHKNKKREARKLNATPDWLTEEHNMEILAIYKKAKELREKTGEVYHVDHIVPLRGETVCGLHVPWNLQVLEASENISKGNREWPDQWRY